MNTITYDNIIFSLQKSGGISVLWSEMLERLVCDNRFDLKVIEYCNAKNNLFRKDLNISIPNPASDKILTIKRYLNNIDKRATPHIFHSSYYRYSQSKAAINITTLHDFTYEYYDRGLAKKIHCHQKYRALEHSDHIVCVSHNTYTDLLKFLPHIDPSKVSIIHNGVSDEFGIISYSDLKGIGVPFAAMEYILFVGARAGYKNFEMTVRAASISKKTLIAVGGGKLTDKETQLIESVLGETRFVHMSGLSNKSLNILYNNALALLYPTFYEGFGIPVIEAQRAGCPVVATYRSSIPEIIGDTQIVIKDPNEHILASYIEQLDINNDFREKEISQAIENSRKFSWDNTYDQLTKLYLSL